MAPPSTCHFINSSKREKVQGVKMNKAGRVQCRGGHNMFCYITLSFLFFGEKKEFSSHPLLNPHPLPSTPTRTPNDIQKNSYSLSM